jgi:crotonobetainyl-CoA:carnitine CoA-transferase CaiB-like acyl-CoA transferase
MSIGPPSEHAVEGGFVPDRPLAGIRVLELAQDIAGPYGGKLLGDLGAEVVKVEPPGGDRSRARGPFPGNQPDPERSSLFRYLNDAKRLRQLDLELAADRDACRELCRWADVVLESGGPGALDRLGLGWAKLRKLNPRLVLVSVSSFGLSGPRAGWRGDDQVAFHSSGFAFGFPSLQVESLDLPPLNAPSYGAAFLAGELIAAAAVHGLLLVQRDGHGCQLDLSLQEAIAAVNQSQFNAFERTGAVRRQATTSPSNPVVPLLPCVDGWVAISPREEHQWTRWLEVIGNPAWGQEPRFADRRARAQHWSELYPLLAAWTAERSRLDIFERAQAARVACYPLGVPTDLFASPQLAARQFFVDAERAEPGSLRFPGIPYRIEGGDQEPDVATSGQAVPPVTLSSSSSTSVSKALPLAGIRIIDFSWVLTGPICTKFLAALGAEVIKVESRARPDLSQRDGSWEELNPSKRSVTLNLKHPLARELARQLISVSDVVVENFSAGVMERLGLGYEALSELNPRLIMASSSALGRSGPERERVAYGTLVQCFTGWAALSAHPGRPPRSAAGIWTDPLTASLETLLLLAAIWRQRATGRGCFFDISMAEATIAALPEPILAWSLNQELLEPRGNRDPLFAPQGCYPASGDDRWLAVSVQDEAAWTSLCRVLARPDLLSDPGLSSAAGRRARHDELDAAISAWTRGRPADQAAAQLQAAGVAATPTLTPADVLTDDHLAARAFVSQVKSLAGGNRATLGFPWLIDGQRPANYRRPPAVGEDNDDVFGNLLALDPVDYRRLVDDQVIY